ncbi:helix-turn-helix domain-containing protein [Vibrio sp. CAIM 722]|uniref:Helix-turn-helix domain-containing protein n=2 Tax=Vibrio TaxID=662 RepID=A0A7X4RT52_9VIBR|nr:helix-turn-helix domain-containing protein [Vibrio eleionomae]
MTAYCMSIDMKHNIYPFVADEIKRLLKTKSISYKHLGDYLSVSEKTITRSLNGHQELSLERLSSICALLNMQLSDLLNLAEKNMSKIHYFNDKQDLAMSENPEIYKLLHGVFSEQNIEVLAQERGKSIAEMYLALRDLEKLDLITIGTNNTCRLCVPKYIAFRPNSRYAKKIKNATMSALLESCCQEITADTTTLKFVSVELTEEEYMTFREDIRNYLLRLVRDQYKKIDDPRSSYTIGIMANPGKYYPEGYNI